MAFGIYLHYPFCRNLCSYCDFYKESFQPDLEKRFWKTVITETQLAAGECDSTASCVTTIYIGGGTPSLANVGGLAEWLNTLSRCLSVADDAEFSVEMNPESVALENLRTLKGLGVNRPIFGIQSFNLALLRRLQRQHCPHDSYRAIYLANALGFINFGADLIFGLPGQTSRMLSADLDQLLKLQPPHISFYQLTLEPGTKLAEWVARGKIQASDQELNLAFYRAGLEQMTEAGYRRYEVSSFAKPGFECRHNLAYWTGEEYMGLGPSAHSFLGGRRLANEVNLGEYLASIEAGRRPLSVDMSGPEERMTEAIMLGLRTAQGISRTAFSARFGTDLESRLNSEQYAMFVESGHLVPDRGRLRLSDEGILLAEEITRRLLK